MLVLPSFPLVEVERARGVGGRASKQANRSRDQRSKCVHPPNLEPALPCPWPAALLFITLPQPHRTFADDGGDALGRSFLNLFPFLLTFLLTPGRGSGAVQASTEYAIPIILACVRYAYPWDVALSVAWQAQPGCMYSTYSTIHPHEHD